MASMLIAAGIAFAEQVPMYSRWIVDFVVADWKLIVLCDGLYWHSRPKVAAKDRGQTNYLRKCGWNVLRFTDKEIDGSPDTCLTRILAYGPPAD